MLLDAFNTFIRISEGVINVVPHAKIDCLLGAFTRETNIVYYNILFEYKVPHSLSNQYSPKLYMGC